MLNKLAAELDTCWPGRVVSLLWGPWRTAGMVSAEVERQFNRRGIHLIAPERGVAALIDELQRGRKGDTEVVLNAGQLPCLTPPPKVEDFPLLGDGTVTAIPDGLEVTRLLDPDRDRYLHDHRLDGHPVLPVAAAMELMAEVAALARPGHEVAELRDVQLLKGVILDDGPRSVTVRATAAQPIGESTVLDVTVVDAPTGRMSYRAEVILRSGLPAAPGHPAPSSSGLDPFPMPLEQAYDELLFQGPLLRGITGIEGMDGERMVATLAPSSPQRCVTGATGRWIIDPVLIDSGFQLCLLWARTHLDVTPLPARVRRYRRFAAAPRGPVRCELRAQMRTDGHILDTQYAFLDSQGHLLAIIEDMEVACSRSLNRLAGAGAGSGPR